ncbi:LexA repressor [Paenibacillus sp. HN-1]|uniref:LexA family protein n=1 Tax=Paenibacillus TaxID=44249 RepID=UPI001CA97D62|nr:MULTISPECIES: HTH domain-containing protein [Paenibacillus]MBY9082367.1 LexA repressor [Paenibacillus sp. CGMCC 1.18879]MBY9085329.1 LexA repressor [Paenibacillus sinensis]
MAKLTKKRIETLKTIEQFIASNGYPPSVRQLALKLGLSSSSTVQNRIDALCDLGYLGKDPNQPRTLRVLRGSDGKAVQG